MLTKAQRKSKARQLTALIEALDLPELLRQHLGVQAIAARTDEDAFKYRRIADGRLELFRLIHKLASEGPIDYGNSRNDSESATREQPAS